MKKIFILCLFSISIFSCSAPDNSKDQPKTEEDGPAKVEQNDEVTKELSTATDELKKYNDDAVEALNELDSL